MASNMPMPVKLVLKGTSHMSLNERFGNLPKTVPQQNAQTQRQQAAAVQVASAKNRRLAQQMANRPTVLSALGTGAAPFAPRGRGRGSPRGGAMQVVQTNRQNNVRSRLTLRGGANQANNVSSVRGRLGTRGSAGGRGNGLRGRVGRGAAVIRGANIQGGRGAGRGFRGRGVGRGGIQRNNNNNFGGENRGGGRGRGRGGRGRRGKAPVANRDHLDNELDAYMAQTKTMDDELLG